MALRNKPGVPQCGWRCVEEIDYSPEGTDDPICEWCCVKRNRQRLYVLEHDNFDGPIKVGSKCKDEAIAKCVDSGPHEDESNNKPEDGVKNGTSDEKPLPVPELLVLAGASIVLMGNLALFEDFYSQLIPERSSPPTQRQHPSESPESFNNRYRNRLSPEVEKRLRDCLKENIKT